MLEASYVLFRLQPYHKNFGKRLVKTPKLYFYDTGLAAYLLGIEGAEQMNIHSSRPALFETLVVVEAIKSRWHQGQSHQCYFWRDHVGLEVDLVIESAEGLRPIEIKSGQTIAKDWFKSLNKWQQLSQNDNQAKLIYGGDKSYVRNGVMCQPWRDMAENSSPI